MLQKNPCTPATLAPAHTPCLFSIDLHTVMQHLVNSRYFLLLLSRTLFQMLSGVHVVVVVVDPTPPTCCQQSPAPESCGSQQSLPPGGKERLHFVGIRPEVQARKGGW